MTDPRASTITRMRLAGCTWDEIGERLGLGREGARTLARRLGCATPRGGTDRGSVVASPDRRRGALPPGAGWALLTAGTALDGAAYGG